MKRFIIIFIAIALFLPLRTVAAQTDEAQDDVATQKKKTKKNYNSTMQDMVVTATRTEEPIKDIPGSVSVITREELDEMPVQTVDEALSYLSGVQQERRNGDSSRSATVSLRGFGNNQSRTLVLVDGVPQNSADMGSVNWNRLNLQDIQRIEVLKGPAAAIYGSYAMGGVINIITVKPTKRFSGSATASYGTNQDWKLRGVVAGRSSDDDVKGVYARVSAIYHNNMGFNNVPSNERDRYNRNTYLDQHGVNVKLGWDMTENNNLELQYTKDQQLVGEGTKMYAYNGVSRSYDTDVWQLRFKGDWEGWRPMINLYFMDTHYGRVIEKMKKSYSHTDAEVDRKHYGVMTNLSRVFGPHTMTVGFDYRDGLMDGVDYLRTGSKYTYLDYGRMRNLGCFAQDQIRWFDDKLVLLLGIRFDSATTYDGRYSTNDPSMSIYNEHYEDHTWTQWSPRAALKYSFLDNLSAYFSYGHAFRAPLLDDMYRTGNMGHGWVKISNPNLGPETSDSFEVGADYEPVGNLKLSGSAYHSIVQDYNGYVITDTVNLYKQVQNIGEVQIWGFEFDAKYDPFKYTDYDLFKRLSIMANYTHNDSRITRFPSRPDLVGKLLSYTPQDSFNVGYTWLNHYINNQITAQYVGRMFSDDTNTSATIDPHVLVNAKVWRNLDFLGRYGENFNVAFSVRNLFDHRYLNSRGSTNTINPGRTMYVELSCKF